MVNRIQRFSFKYKSLAYVHFILVSLLILGLHTVLSRLFFINWLYILTGRVGRDLLALLIVAGCLVPFVLVIFNKGYALFASLAATITSLCITPIVGIIFFLIILGGRGNYGDVAMLAVPFGILGGIILSIVALPALYTLFFFVWMGVFVRRPLSGDYPPSVPFILRLLGVSVVLGIAVLFVRAHPYRAAWTLSQMGQATWLDQEWSQKAYIRDPVIQRLQFLANTDKGEDAPGYEETEQSMFFGSATNADWLFERAAEKSSLDTTMQPILLTAFRNEKSPLRDKAAQLLFKQRDPALRDELIQYAGHSSLVNMFGTLPDDPYIAEKDVEPIRQELLKGR